MECTVHQCIVQVITPEETLIKRNDLLEAARWAVPVSNEDMGSSSFFVL